MPKGGKREGAGRKQIDNAHAFLVRLSGEDRATLEAYCAKHACSLSEAVRRAVSLLGGGEEGECVKSENER